MVTPNATEGHFFSIQGSKNIYLTQQGSNEGVDEYFASFETARELVQLFDANVIDTDELLKTEKVVNQNATKDTVTQKCLAMCLIMNANRNKYGISYKTICWWNKTHTPPLSVQQLTFSPTGRWNQPPSQVHVTTVEASATMLMMTSQVDNHNYPLYNYHS